MAKLVKIGEVDAMRHSHGNILQPDFDFLYLRKIISTTRIMLKKLLLFHAIFLYFSILTVYSQHVASDRARTVAMNFLYERIHHNQGSPFRSFSILDEFQRRINDTLLYYIFTTSPEGFIVVSAWETTRPVIGYSYTGSYREDGQPCNFRSWMSHYEEEIMYLLRNDLAPGDHLMEWEALMNGELTFSYFLQDREVEPLLVSTWNQDFPYNYKCPADPAGPHGHCLAGCVATAMGQLMYYYRWPQTGTGSYSYIHPDYGEISTDFGSTTYRWEEMPTAIPTTNDALNELLFHIGVSVDMDYGPLSSGMWNHKAAYSYKTYFKYAPETQYVYRDSTSMDWDSLVVAHLDRNMPCYYAGWADYTYTSGHAFIVDGYQGEYFHMNWGWGGYLDGYFLLDELTPGGNDFNYAQELIIHCYPDTLSYSYPPAISGSDTLRSLTGSFDDGSGPMDNYPPGITFTWLIDPQTPQDSVIRINLQFHRFRTAPGDVVKVYDGSTTEDALLGSFDGDNLPEPVTSSTNQMLVTFTTDNSSEAPGWLCTYTTQSPVWCTGITTLTEPVGEISDGSGTFNYKNNSICQWRIMPSGWSGIALNFSYFDTEATADYVKIYDLQSQTLLGEYSGATLPGTVLCPSNKMLVLFATNDALTAGGWEASYESFINATDALQGEHAVTVYPVPARESLFIKLEPGSDGPFSLTLMTMTGQVVSNLPEQVSVNGSTTAIDVSRLQKGSYILKIKSKENVFCKKVLIY